MKVCFFEVRDDEKGELERIKAQNAGLEVVCCGEALTKENLSLVQGAAGVSILAGTKLTRELLDQLKALGVTCASTRTIGRDHIDADYAKEIGVTIRSASYPPNAVADFTVMLMLIAVRKYKPALWRQQVNDFSLAGLQGKNLNELTVGIVGTGRIGQQVAKNLSGFGCKILAYDPYPRPELLQGIAEYTTLAELYRRADIITLHVPLVEENRRMIDANTLQQMKDGVILVNTARGELMDLDAVIHGIETQKLGAVAMDVFEHDIGIYHVDHRSDILVNPEMAYFRQFPNVILTQHMAFYTEESVNYMVRSSFQAFAEELGCNIVI